jgi:FdhD protein
VLSIQHCTDGGRDQARGNVLRIELAPSVVLDWTTLARHVYTTSSCGVCGKASIEALRALGCPVLPADGLVVDPELIHALPDALREAQAIFDHTGGLHAAGLFDPSGRLLLLREDVGRHNALDKLIGAALQRGWLPLDQHMVLLSGRVSFELVQKALMAGLPLLAAVGAPSSLAVALAEETGLTLLGFVRSGRFNVYTGAQRLGLADGPDEETTQGAERGADIMAP